MYFNNTTGKMLKIISPWSNLFSKRIASSVVKRFFLSNAYKCEEAWDNRLKSSIFQNIDFLNMYHELDVKFKSKARVAVVDVDLLLNVAKNESYKNEIEDVLLQIRKCPENSILPDSATHAAIRFLIDYAPKEDVLNALSDRLNYGLFLDYYLANLLIDKFLKEKDAISAVKVAVLQMFQEDFDHPIMKALILHCCYNYLESSEIWETYKEPDPDPDEQVVKVRVRWARNPHFDDHFDIKDTNHLVGKTLWLCGSAMNDTIGTSSQLVGLVLYEKYQKCAEFLNKVISNKTKLYAEAVAKAREYALKKPKQASDESSPEESNSENKTQEINVHKNEVLKLLDKIDESILVKGNLLEDTHALVKKAVEDCERNDIEQQCKIYQEWEKEREDNIKKELLLAQKKSAQEEIIKMKKEMEVQEKKLFFYDDEKEIDMVVQQNLKLKKRIRKYRPRGKEKLGKGEYIPPDIKQK